MRSFTRQVLVVEDDFLQAMDLEALLGKSGVRVLGPVPSVEEGMKLVRYADAAVLDIMLKESEVFPLADVLEELKKPFVFYTGSESSSLPERFRHVQLIRKPMQTLPEATLRALTAFPAAQDDTIEALLPKLRLSARLMCPDATVSDRLVERVLMEAIAHAKVWRELGSGADRSDWLLARMRRIADESGSQLMN